jgi:hypothetical protein
VIPTPSGNPEVGAGGESASPAQPNTESEDMDIVNTPPTTGQSPASPAQAEMEIDDMGTSEVIHNNIKAKLTKMLQMSLFDWIERGEGSGGEKERATESDNEVDGNYDIDGGNETEMESDDEDEPPLIKHAYNAVAHPTRLISTTTSNKETSKASPTIHRRHGRTRRG